MAAVMKNTRTKKVKSKTSNKKKLADQTVEEFMLDSVSDEVSSEASFTQQTLPSSNAKKTRVTDTAARNTKQKKDKRPKKSTDVITSSKTKTSQADSLLQIKDPIEDDDDDDDVSGEDPGSDVSEDLWQEDPTQKRKKKQAEAAKRAFEKEILGMSSGSDDSEDDGEGQGGLFQPPGKLQVASDEEDSDTEGDDDDASDDGAKVARSHKTRTKITSTMIQTWTTQIQDSPSVEVLREVVGALAAAAQHVGLSVESDSNYRIEGSSDFNAIMRLCLTEVVPALESLLKLKSLSEQHQAFSHKNKKWRGLKGTMKTYCTLLLQLCGELSEASMVSVLLRHVHKLVVCYAAFPKLTKVFLKRLIRLWSGGEETTRVLAFLCVNKLVRLLPDTMLEPTLKQMYMAYVNNCKFVSPTSLPLINFMQRSLVEVFLVREEVAYQHAFLFVRQLAIHLRNAITTKKKELCQAVYNWQYVLSLGLWTELLSTAHPSATLQPLVYPLVQVITGTIRLLPTARYYPLRFHCVKDLIRLSAATNTFVPVVPFLLEVLEQTDFNKRAKGGSVKHLSLHTILKFSQPQLQEKAFKDAVIEQLCELFLDYLHSQSHTIAFPDLIIPLLGQLKDFVKRCKVPTLVKQVRQVVDKAEETAKVVEGRRRAATFNLSDAKAVESWEVKNKEEGNPLATFYKSWKKLRDQKIQRDIAAKDQMTTAAEDIPKITRGPLRGPLRASDQDRKEFAGLFGDSDDDDDDNDDSATGMDSAEDDNDLDDDDSDEEGDEEEAASKQTAAEGKKAQKRKQQTQKVVVKRKKLEVAADDKGDIVEDFEMSDFD